MVDGMKIVKINRFVVLVTTSVESWMGHFKEEIDRRSYDHFVRNQLRKNFDEDT